MDNDKQDEKDGTASQSNAVSCIDLEVFVAENSFQDLHDDCNPQMDCGIEIRLHIDDEHTRIVIVTFNAPVCGAILTPGLVIGMESTLVFAGGYHWGSGSC